MALQHGLEAVNALQSQIDNIAKLLKPGDPSKATEFAPTPEASESIENLKKAHSVLSNEIEALYGSLNIPSSLPQLRDYPPEFVSLLVITRDMKMALRDRVQQSVFSFMKDPPPGSGALSTERVRDLVCRAFLIEFMKS